jgi:hypothetical protein
MLIFDCSDAIKWLKTVNVLLDCELVRGADGSQFVFVFDILVLDQACVWKYDFSVRQSFLEKLFNGTNTMIMIFFLFICYRLFQIDL